MNGGTDLGNPRVVVLGTGLAELGAAYEFARFGVPVTVIDDASTPRAIPRVPQSDPDGVLAAWITAIGTPLREGGGPEASPTHISPGTQWVHLAGVRVRVPDASVFGIPTSPLSRQTTESLGTGAAFRAYLDRVTPVLTIGKAQFVSTLVRKRVGARVLDTLVDPLVTHMFGVDASATQVSQLAPGLNETLTRAGSLTGAALAYLERYETLAGGVMPDIGWDAFTDLLQRRLEAHGVRWVSTPDTVQVRVDEARDEGETRGRVIVSSGSQRVRADVLITPDTPLSGLSRTEITLVHDEAPGMPGISDASRMTETFSTLDGEAAGWTRRTVVLPGQSFVTELRSPATEDARGCDPDAIIMAAGCEVGARDVRTTHAPPLPATDAAAQSAFERRTSDSAVIDTRVHISERGLAVTVSETHERAQALRRAILDLA